jgi:hypothetical protein
MNLIYLTAAGILHGFTSWYGDAYDLRADARSWESMMSSFQELMAVPVSTEATNGTVGTDGDGASTDSTNDTVATDDETEVSAASPSQLCLAAISGIVGLVMVLQ